MIATLLLAALGALACEARHATHATTPPWSPPASSPAVGASASDATPSESASASADPFASATTIPERSPDADRLVVHLVPLGDIAPEMVAQAAAGLRDHAPTAPVIEPSQALPSHAESSEKRRYRAENLLSWLSSLPIAPGGKIMGITDIDIVTTKGNLPNWGILGLGSLDGRCSVISTYRMKRKWEHGGAPDELVRERLWKVAIHELGHTLGLEHCPVVGCIMEDGHGTVKTTDRDSDLCERCAKRFAEALRRETR